MNERSDFEHIVGDSVTSIGVPAPSDGAIERTVSRASTKRQRPRWLALIKEPPMRISSRLAVGSPSARVLAIMVATMLLTLLVAGAGLAGSRLLAEDDQAKVGNGPIIVNGTAYDPYTGAIGPDPCNCTTDASWSADGRLVAFRRSSRIFVVDTEDGSERHLTDCTGCDDATDHISMAADGRQVAFTDDGDIWMVEVDTGTPTRITDLGDGRSARAPTLAPAGERIAFVIAEEPGIWVADLGGGQPRQLITDTGPPESDGIDLGPYEPAWSPDGRTIAYLRDPLESSVDAGFHLQLWLVDVVTGEQRQIWDNPGCCVTQWGGPAWSPDGRELALVAYPRPGWSLWVVAADGSMARRLAGADPVRPAWRPVPLAEAPVPPAASVAEAP